MSAENAVVAVCHLPIEAESAIAVLRAQSIEPDCISLVTVDQQSGLMPIAYYFDGARLRKTGAGGQTMTLWEAIPGRAILVCPGERTVFLAGSVAACVVRALDNEGLFGGLGPIAGALYSLGISRDAARDYELSALQGRPLVIVHGRARDVERARRILGAREGNGMSDPLPRPLP